MDFQSLPSSTDSKNLEISLINATSTRSNLTYAIIVNSTSDLSSVDYGFSMQGNIVTISHKLLANISKINFPLSGVITVTDDRSSCNKDSFDQYIRCKTDVPFIFNIAEFNPNCPKDVIVFSPDTYIQVDWIEPRLRMRSGNYSSLQSSHRPGQYFSLGTTLVEYALNPQVGVQLPESVIHCNFKVFTFVSALLYYIIYNLFFLLLYFNLVGMTDILLVYCFQT